MSGTSDYRLSLRRNGYLPLPIKTGTKRPPMNEWPRLANATTEDIQGWDTRYSNSPGTGIILGTVGMLDIDVTDVAAAESLRETARGWLQPLGKILIRFGKRPKCGFLFRTEVPFTKKSHSYIGGHKLELLGQGQQAVIDGIHPDTGKRYEFEHGVTPEEIAADELPLLTENGAAELLDFLDEMLCKHFGFVHAGNGHARHQTNADLPDRMAHCQPDSNKLDLKRWFATFDGTGASANHVQPPALRALALDGVAHNEAAKIVVGAIMAEAPSDWTEAKEYVNVYVRQRSVLNSLLREHDWTKGGVPDWMSADDQVKCAAIIGRGEIPAYGRNRFGCYLYNASSTGRHRERKGATGTRAQADSPTAAAPPSAPALKKVSATPFRAFDERALRPRAFLYASHYQRGEVTCSVGQDGAGKSTLTTAEAIAMATARNILGEQPAERCRVWLYNADDSTEQIWRRIAAVCRLNNIDMAELEGWLFVDGKDHFQIKVTKSNGGVVPDAITLAQISATIIENQIDVAIFDPLVTLHGVSENDNVHMSEVIHLFGEIAVKCDCAIELCHHTRKPSNTNREGEKEFNSDDSRGAGAIRAAVRASRVFNRMSKADALKAGLQEEARVFYIRIDRGKANYLPPAIKGDWFELKSVQLLNGENVGTVAPWTFPGQTTEATPAKQAADQRVDTVFLQLLTRLNTAGVEVTAKMSRSGAPEVFARQPEAKLARIGKAAFAEAMDRLLANGGIYIKQTKVSGHMTGVLRVTP
jgi:hypothetical protein